MKNFAAEKIEKRLKTLGVFEKYKEPENTTFISTKNRKTDKKSGAISWFMFSNDRSVMYASSLTATECANRKFPIRIKAYKNGHGVALERMLRELDLPDHEFVLVILEEKKGE